MLKQNVRTPRKKKKGQAYDQLIDSSPQERQSTASYTNGGRLFWDKNITNSLEHVFYLNRVLKSQCKYSFKASNYKIIHPPKNKCLAVLCTLTNYFVSKLANKLVSTPSTRSVNRIANKQQYMPNNRL